MDIYHIWCNLKQGNLDTEFADAVDKLAEKLISEQKLVSYRLTRRKLGLAPDNFREFHITLEFNDLLQLDSAFNIISSRDEPVERLHFMVNHKVKDVQFALYRDFPDKHRVRGKELF